MSEIIQCELTPYLYVTVRTLWEIIQCELTLTCM